MKNSIKVERAKKDLTQEQLAEIVGVTRQTINAIEGGKYAPSLEVAFRIARILRRPIDDVFQFEVTPA